MLHLRVPLHPIMSSNAPTPGYMGGGNTRFGPLLPLIRSFRRESDHSLMREEGGIGYNFLGYETFFVNFRFSIIFDGQQLLIVSPWLFLYGFVFISFCWACCFEIAQLQMREVVTSYWLVPLKQYNTQSRISLQILKQCS